MPENEKEQPWRSAPPHGQFSIKKIYIKDISFETPNSPHIFRASSTIGSIGIDQASYISKLFTDITDDGFRIEYETSTDGGETWFVSGKASYQRVTETASNR